MKATISRRQFLSLSALSAAAVAGMAGSAMACHSNQPQLSLLDIHIADLPRNFIDYRIGFISDIHLGPCNGEELTEKAVSILNQQDVDMVLLGGDYILMPDMPIERALLSLINDKNCYRQGYDYQVDLEIADSAYATIARTLSKLKSKDGVFAVYGNHDLWVSPSLCHQHLMSEGIQMLVNEVKICSRKDEKLLLLGSDDYWAGLPNLPKLPAKEKGQEVRVVLSHNPDHLSELMHIEKYPFDLGLAGHTHGGQIKLPLIGAPHYNIQDTRVAEGLYQYGQWQTYTSRGIGSVGIPIRINCPAEVSVFRLKSA